MPTSRSPQEDASHNVFRWRGLGHWNFYFLAKFLLFWAGYLNLDVFYNAVFAAALLLPLGHGWLNRLRHAAAVPVAVALLYHDSWFPPFSRLLAQPEVFDFAPDYLLEILGRFVNWNLIAAGFLVWVVYLYLAPWIRLTTVNVSALALLLAANHLTLPAWFTEATQNMASPNVLAQAGALPDAENPGMAPTTTRPEVIGKPGNEQLNTMLADFYVNEQSRRVAYPESAGSPPFDVLLISICSLSWSDLEESQLLNHPLFGNLNIVLDNFNSATSYSGPAVLRLMRASCGQTPHAELYKPADDQCYLFENLKKLGFSTASALNHNGEFQNFLGEIRDDGKLPAPFIPTDTRPFLTSFDGSPIWDDFNTLNQWWSRRLASPDARTALFYNTITLHDGNREATADGGGRTAPYDTRARRLLDELDAFIRELEKSGRQALVILIPEHGAALKADRMQIAGMREVPTRSITHVPVGVRLVGTRDVRPAAPLHVSASTSFLALSSLVARVLEQDVFTQENIDWNALTLDLPVTESVSENEGTVVMDFKNQQYVRVDGRNWIEYPN